jgi:hypothetical protein
MEILDGFDTWDDAIFVAILYNNNFGPENQISKISRVKTIFFQLHTDSVGQI